MCLSNRLLSIIACFFIIGGSVSHFSCKKKGCTDPKATNYDPEAKKDDATCQYDDATVTFLLDHQVDGNALEYNKMNYTNTAGNEYQVEKLLYYISDIQLHRSNGKTVRIDTVQYRDGKAPNTREFGPHHIPNGTYTKMTFILGLDSTKNKTGYLPNTQTNNNMAWPEPMGGGYHYTKLEGSYIDSSGSEVNYKIHVGELDMNDTTQEHTIVKVTVNFPSDLTADYNDWNVTLIMNINEWYENPNTYNFSTYGQAIMGDPSAQRALKQNANKAFHIASVQQQ